MNSKEIAAKYREYLLPSTFTYYQEPIAIARGKGQYLWDVEGNQYLDFFGGIVTIGVGHCHDTVTSAIKEQVDTLQHTSTVFPNRWIVELAEKLAEITPGRLKQSFFTNSGTEANETAVMLAKAYTGRSEVVALRHGYHGRSALAQSLVGHASWRVTDPAVSGIKHAAAPYCYRCPFGQQPDRCGLECAEDLRTVIQTATTGEIAAFIAEPIMGVGGFIVPPAGYFKAAVGIVREHGGLFIADEVQTAWGRTGDRWFGIEHAGVEPELMTSAKSLGNGLPIGWTIATPEVAASVTKLHIATFGGNPVSMRGAKAVLDVIEAADLRRNSRVVGDYFRDGLLGLQEKYPLIGDVRGQGLMQALEFVTDRQTKAPAAAAVGRFMEATKKQRLLVGKGGLHGNVIRMSPPMTIGKADVDQALKLLDLAFADVSQG